MLIFSPKLLKYKVQETGNMLGRVSGFLLNSRTWNLKYLRVTFGFRTFRKKFIIPVDRLGFPDRVNKIIPTDLSMDEIEHLPIAFKDSFSSGDTSENIVGYWRIGKFGRLFTWQIALKIRAIYNKYKKWPSIPQTEHILSPQMRSMNEIEGYRVDAKKGEIGKVKDFIINVNDWEIFAVVVSGLEDEIKLPSQLIGKVNPVSETLKLI